MEENVAQVHRGFKKKKKKSKFCEFLSLNVAPVVPMDPYCLKQWLPTTLQRKKLPSIHKCYPKKSNLSPPQGQKGFLWIKISEILINFYGR